jgi:hypothetical protein
MIRHPAKLRISPENINEFYRAILKRHPAFERSVRTRREKLMETSSIQMMQDKQNETSREKYYIEVNVMNSLANKYAFI